MQVGIGENAEAMMQRVQGILPNRRPLKREHCTEAVWGCESSPVFIRCVALNS